MKNNVLIYWACFIIGVIVTIIFTVTKEPFEQDFFIKKYDTNNVKVIQLIQEDSAYSPHEELNALYKATHNMLDSANVDSLYEKFIELRRYTMSPKIKNCVKKTFAIKVDDNEPQLENLFYVHHRGKTCIHDYEGVIRTFADIDNHFYFFKHKKIKLTSLNEPIDTCKH